MSNQTDRPVAMVLWEEEPAVVTESGRAYYFDGRHGKWVNMPPVPNTPADLPTSTEGSEEDG